MMASTLQANRVGGEEQKEPFFPPLTNNIPTLAEMTAAAINVLDNDLIHADRPESFELNTKFTACYSCPLSNLCNEWEEKRFSTDEFVNKASSIFNKERK